MARLEPFRHALLRVAGALLVVAFVGALSPAEARRAAEDHIAGKNLEVSGLRFLKVSRCCKARDSDYPLFFRFDDVTNNWEAYATEDDLLNGVNHVMSGVYRPNGRSGRRYELLIDPSGVNDFLESVIKPWATDNLDDPEEVLEGKFVNLSVRKAKMKLNVTLKNSGEDIKSATLKGSFKLRRKAKPLEDAGRKGSGIFRLKLNGGELPPV